MFNGERLTPGFARDGRDNHKGGDKGGNNKGGFGEGGGGHWAGLGFEGLYCGQGERGSRSGEETKREMVLERMADSLLILLRLEL